MERARPPDAIDAESRTVGCASEGTVDWDYQRTTAAEVVKFLTGVKGITNRITVRPRVLVPDVKARIEAALRRNAEVEAHRITVHLQDSTVTLRGHVQSLAERAAAESAAWAAPGVTTVKNQLEIEP
jgi:osmotically-inducible protein OsmY